jgi:hypothetical protein
MDIIREIQNGNLQNVILLLDNGIDLNTTYNNRNDTLLHCSIKNDQFDIFYELINRGANINQPNNLGLTVIDLCRFFEYIDPLIKLLELNAYLYTVRADGYTCIRGAIFQKNTSKKNNTIYNLIMFADRAYNGDLEYIKSQILTKNFDVKITTWINYLSIVSCLELYNWLKPITIIYYLLGRDKHDNLIKQQSREQVSNIQLIALTINSYLEPKYIIELRMLLLDRL